MGKRNSEIDILKAIAIMLMVAGHAETPIKSFIYLFHMPVFIIASGYFYNTKYSDNAKGLFKFIKKRIVGLWFPYFVANSIFAILNNTFIKLNVYTTNSKILLLNTAEYAPNVVAHYYSISDIIKNIIRFGLLEGGTQIGGGLWFLSTLFKVSIIYCLIEYVLKKITSRNNNIVIIQATLSLLLLIIGWLLGRRGIYAFGISRVCSVYFMWFIGHQLSSIKHKEFTKIQYGIGFLSALFALAILSGFGDVELSSNYFSNPIILMIGSSLGWVLLYSASHLLTLFAVLQKPLMIIGQNTLSVLILHLLCFKVINLIIVLLEKMDMYLIAAFPTLSNGKGLWWILYTIVGLFVPVVINLIKKSMLNKKHNLGRE